MTSILHEVDPAWADQRFSFGHRTQSLHHHQSDAADTRCVVTYTTAHPNHPATEQMVLCQPFAGCQDINYQLFIGGGTDHPYVEIRLTLRHSNIIPTNGQPHHTLAVRFYAVLEGQESSYERTPVELEDAAKTTYMPRIDFSSQLNFARFRQPPEPSQIDAFQNLPIDVTLRDYFMAALPDNRMQCISWFTSAPYGINMDSRFPGLTVDQQTEVTRFTRFQRQARAVRVFCRGNTKLWDYWKVLASMPFPSPLPHWRYHVIEDIPAADDTLISEYHGRRVQPPKRQLVTQLPPLITPLELASYHPTTYFWTDADYELMSLVSMKREAEKATETDPDWFDGDYACELRAADEFFPEGLKNAYVILLNTSRDGRRSHLDPPSEGAEATVRIYLNNVTEPETWTGVVQPKLATISDHNLAILAMRPASRSGGFVYGPGIVLRVNMTFLQNPESTKVKDQHIRRLLYGCKPLGIEKHSVFKKLVMGRHLAAAHTFSLVEPGGSINNPELQSVLDEEIRCSRLNPLQEEAFRRVFSTPAGVAIIQAPPGTGKTEVIIAVLLAAYRLGIKVQVMAESNKAIRGLTLRLEEAVRYRGLTSERILLAKTRAYEQYIPDEDGDSADVPGATAVAPTHNSNPPDRLSPDMRAALHRSIMKIHASIEPPSPGSIMHIAQRLRQKLQSYQEDPEDYPDTGEAKIFKRLFALVNSPPNPNRTYNVDYAAAVNRHFREVGNVWVQAMQAVVTSALIILTTIGNSNARSLKKWDPTILLIEESSQAKEPETVAACARRLPSARSIAFFGDLNQLGPTIVSERSNEFSDQLRDSLSTRLIKGGWQTSFLTTQYRMHPGITRLLNRLVYVDHPLEDHFTTAQRSKSLTFANWTSSVNRCFQNVVLVSCSNGVLARERLGYSKVNFASIAVAILIIKDMISSGRMRVEDISYIAPYKAHLKEFNRAISADPFFQHSVPKAGTVDSFQGDENDYVLLDAVTPGGDAFAEGFSTNKNRTTVGISRARHGLLIIGTTALGSRGNASAGKLMWKGLIEELQQQDAVWEIRGPNGWVASVPAEVRQRYVGEFRNGDIFELAGLDTTNFDSITDVRTVLI